MNSQRINVDPWSLASLQIELFYDERPVSHATGSIWKLENEHYLVTNWHNFTGKHRETGRHLSRTNCEPNKVVVHYVNENLVNSWVEKCYDLVDCDGVPLWHDHPNTDLLIDLVALKVDPPTGLSIFSPNLLPKVDLLTSIGTDLFVIGYPFKIETVGLPVWKRASLASELDMLAVSPSPRFFVDTATRQGMSGSIVIRKEVGSWSDVNGNTVVSAGKVAHRFMGIYSGRYGGSEDGSAQLGIVWSEKAVNELLTHARIQSR